MNSSGSIRDTILSFLKSSPVPLTAIALRIRLRVRSIKLAEYEVWCELRSIREEGLVLLERGRWSVPSTSAMPPILNRHTSESGEVGGVSFLPSLPLGRTVATGRLLRTDGVPHCNSGHVPIFERLLGHDRLTTTEIYLNLSPEEVLQEFREKW